MMKRRPSCSTCLGLIVLSALLVTNCDSGAREDNSQSKAGLEVSFRKHVIHSEFISEGVAVADVNKDGQPDILAGFYWFEAPAWTPHEIRSPKLFDYKQEWSDSFLNFSMDVNNDGWQDFIRFDFPGRGVYWYENPRGVEGVWSEKVIDSNACNESPMMADVDGDSRMDLVFGNEAGKEMKWFKPPARGTGEWSQLSISVSNSPGTTPFSHGLGFVDINADGRNDIIIREGWWEAPENPLEVPWQFHEAGLGEPCSQMFVYDFDSDGDSDVISASAHNYGIWWHEQTTGENQEATFVKHLIDESFSQTHGVALHDMNGDGLPDLITGKRYFAHNGKDPGGTEPAVIYWYELQRDDDNRPKWIPHLIDADSGIGLQVVIEDMNKDGKPDIVVANKKGVFYFEND